MAGNAAMWVELGSDSYHEWELAGMGYAYLKLADRQWDLTVAANEEGLSKLADAIAAARAGLADKAAAG